MYNVIARLVAVVAQVVVLLALTVGLFVAFMGLPAVVAGILTPAGCVSVAITALAVAFLLLIGNHREEGPHNSYELSVLLKEKIAKGDYQVVKGVFSGDKVYLADPPSEIKITW